MRVQLHNVRLDAFRGLACLLVLVGHARALSLVDWPLQRHTPLGSVLYALTGLGQQAVVAFFALSGYWVGGQVLQRWRTKDLRLSSYLIDRASRICVVAWPSLVLALGVFAMVSHTGASSAMMSVMPRGAAGSPVASFVGSWVFLQPHVVSAPSTNGALWSLGYEVQYYIFAPALAVLFSAHFKLRSRLLAALVSVVMVLVMGPTGLLYLATWCSGILVRLVLQYTTITFGSSWVWLISLLSTLATAMLDSVVQSFMTTLLLAICAALCIGVAARTDANASVIARTLGWIGGWSFSLYAFHLPVMLFIAAFLGMQTHVSLLKGVIEICAYCAIAGFISYLIFLATERRTPQLRRRLKSWASAKAS